MLSHFSCVWLFVTPWTVALQAPLSMGFSRKEYWSELPFPLPGYLPDPLKLHLLQLLLCRLIFYCWASWEAHLICVQFSSVQSLSRVRLFATPWIAARQASLSISNSRSSLKTHVHRISDAIQPSHPLLSPSPPAPNPSQHQSLFQWVNSSHEVAKVLEFQL